MSWWLRSNAEWPIWRIVMEDNGVSLREIDEHWSVDDVLDANEVMDVMSDVTGWRRPKAPTTAPLVGRR